jgi:hypothetical protein
MGRILRRATAGVFAAVCGAAFAAAPPPEWARRDIRAGIIGCDTSHVLAFTDLLHANPQWRIRVVAAFGGGSPDMPGASMAPVAEYTRTLRERHQVEIVETIAALLERVDVVLLESVDGRPHLEQARPVIAARKLLFIDKPFTGSLKDALELLRLAREGGVAFFSSSCVRFQPEVAKLRKEPGVPKLAKVQASSPLSIEPHHPDLFWYGIHGVEALYTVMGRGCVSVTRKAEGEYDFTTGKWADGRTGVFRGAIGKGTYLPLVQVWGEGGETADTGKAGYNYRGLCEAVAQFFHTGVAPIDPQETLEIIEFMTAAQLSKERGGAEVKLEELRK